jgi:hypothetical protein
LHGGAKALQKVAVRVLQAKVDALIAELETCVVEALRDAVGEHPDVVTGQPVDGDDIESGTGQTGLAQELGKAVLWGLVEDARRLLVQEAAPLITQAAKAVAISADHRAATLGSKLTSKATELTPLMAGAVHAQGAPEATVSMAGFMASLQVAVQRYIYYSVR